MGKNCLSPVSSSKRINFEKIMNINPEEYASLARTIARRVGFGLIFVECDDNTAQDIVCQKIHEDFPDIVQSLTISEPIDSLYDILEEKSKLNSCEILTIQGLELSILKYEQDTFGSTSYDSEENRRTFHKSLQGVPRFLGYLNLQRDRFRDDFNVCFVFLVTKLEVDYFINRAPDFFDWRSALVKF